MNGFERFDEYQLSPNEKFYKSLKDYHIAVEDYNHAHLVYSGFNPFKTVKGLVDYD